jgi:hypothetical protein
MLPEARVGAKGETPDPLWRDLAGMFDDARRELAGDGAARR